MKWIALWIVLTIPLTSCGATGGEGCDAWRPILVSATDGLTPETAREILAHNRTGRRLCGW